jgi:hypothetical protein
MLTVKIIRRSTRFTMKKTMSRQKYKPGDVSHCCALYVTRMMTLFSAAILIMTKTYPISGLGGRTIRLSGV